MTASVALWFLHRLPAETAHNLTLLALRLRWWDAVVAADRTLNWCWFVPLVYGCLAVAVVRWTWRRMRGAADKRIRFTDREHDAGEDDGFSWAAARRAGTPMWGREFREGWEV